MADVCTMHLQLGLKIKYLLHYSLIIDWNVLIFPRNVLSSVQRNERTHVWLIDWLIVLIICFITDITTVLLSRITQHGLYCLLSVNCYVDSVRLVNLATVCSVVPNRHWVVRSGKKAQKCGMQFVYYFETCAKVIYELPSTIFVPWVMRVWWILWLSNN